MLGFSYPHSCGSECTGAKVNGLFIEEQHKIPIPVCITGRSSQAGGQHGHPMGLNSAVRLSQQCSSDLTFLSNLCACPGLGKMDEPKVPDQLDNPFLAPTNVSVASCERNSVWQNSGGSWDLCRVPAVQAHFCLLSRLSEQTLSRAGFWRRHESWPLCSPKIKSAAWTVNGLVWCCV